MASITNLYVDQGSDYDTVITVNASTGLPLNLSNYTVISQLRKSFDSTLAYDFTAAVTGSPTEGRIRLTMAAAYSATIPAGRWMYDVLIVNNETNATRRVVEGIVIINPRVSIPPVAE